MKTKKSVKLEVVGDYSMAGTRRMQAPGNLRAGNQTMGSRSSLQNDLETEESAEKQSEDSLPKAAICLVTKGDKILAVSRGKDMNNMNLPGGTVEDGEDPMETAMRELWEETGIKAKEIFPIYTKVNGGWLVTTYRVPVYSGDLKASFEGTPAWVNSSDISNGVYGRYFDEMMKSLTSKLRR